MIKKSCAWILAIIMMLALLPTSVFAVTLPNIYKEEITLRVGNTTRVDFEYGETATSAEMFISNAGIDAYITGGAIYITGLSEGLSYVTLTFNDGTVDSLKVNVVGQHSNVDTDNNIVLKINRFYRRI